MTAEEFKYKLDQIALQDNPGKDEAGFMRKKKRSVVMINDEHINALKEGKALHWNNGEQETFLIYHDDSC